jgi:hypothetical protein
MRPPYPPIRYTNAYDPRRMHLRPPSIDQGVQAGLWAVGLGLLIWLGLLSFDVSGATAFIMAALAAAAIFFYVRLYGGDEPQVPRR